MAKQRHAAMEQLEYLKAVFTEEGADGVGKQLQSMGINALRTLTSAAGLPLRAGGKLRPASDLRSAVKDHVTRSLGADGEEQAGNLHHSVFCRLSKERIHVPL